MGGESGGLYVKVKLLAHTQITGELLVELSNYDPYFQPPHDGKMVTITAIRTCYSANKPSEILFVEWDRYFERAATDGEDGVEADRLIRSIARKKPHPHTSTFEHVSFVFAIEGISRACLAQLTRHRHFSFSVQSQRYVRFGTGDKTGGFDYVVPPTIKENHEALQIYGELMHTIQAVYDKLRSLGVPAEDARFVLPNAAAINLVMTANLRALLEFYSKRRRGRGAQWEIAELAERMRKCVVEVEPWLDQIFEEV